MTLQLDDKVLQKIMRSDYRKISHYGDSFQITIPIYLFKLFWNKEDKVKIYVLNEHTLIIINQFAEKRELQFKLERQRLSEEIERKY